MAKTKEILVNGQLTQVTEFDHSAQEIDDAVGKVKGGPSAMGAAPAGYGAGEYVYRNADKRITSLAALDTVFLTGVYGCNFPSADKINEYTLYDCVLTVGGYIEGRCWQELRLNNSSYALRRFCYNSVWYPWEWVNPPMALGVEYRTTERSEGKPVYAKRLSYTPASNITSGTATNIPHGISNFGTIVRTSGRVVNLTIPYLGLNGTYAGIRAVDKTNIEFCTNGFGWNSGYPGLFDLYYTKTAN